MWRACWNAATSRPCRRCTRQGAGVRGRDPREGSPCCAGVCHLDCSPAGARQACQLSTSFNTPPSLRTPARPRRTTAVHWAVLQGDPPAAGVHHAGLRAGAGGVRAHRGAAGALPKQVGLLAAPRIDSCVAMCRCNSVCDCALCSLWRRRRCAVLQALRSACLPATPCHARPQGQCDGVGLLHLGSHGHLFLFHQQRPNGT